MDTIYWMVQPLLLKLGHLELVVQNHVQKAFEDLKDEESITFLGNP